MKEEKYYFKSNEARKELRISDCNLAHMRVDGKLRFVKKGNAFMYFKEDIVKHKPKE